jgi:hypothetical protein
MPRPIVQIILRDEVSAQSGRSQAQSGTSQAEL